jgi:ATP-binding cassette subfamily B protein
VIFASRLWPYILRYRLRMSIGLVALACASMASVMTPYVLGGAIDSFRTDHSTNRLYVFAGLTIGIQAIDSILRYVTRIYVSGSSRYMEYDLRNDVYAHMQSLDQKFFQDHQTGDLMARVSNDVSTVRDFPGPGLMDLFRSIFLFVGGLAVMLTIDEATLLATLPRPS